MIRWYVAALVLAVGLLVYGLLALDIDEALGHQEDEPLVHAIEGAEGWRGKCYVDSTGHGTIAFGIKLPLTREEGGMLLRHRLGETEHRLAAAWPPFKSLSQPRQRALLEMGYVLGVRGVLGFRRALGALEAGNFAKAADEVLDSRFARQLPVRAGRLAAAIRSGRAE